MEKPQNKIDNYRYEKKLLVSELSVQEILAMIKLHPSIFSEIYHERIINNIYLDSPDYSSYVDNLSGIGDREKVRIRWYGETFGQINDPALELKIKKGSVGGKDSYKLKSFILTKRFTYNHLLDICRRSNLPEIILYKLSNLHFTVLTKYKRKYFLSSCKKYRLTLDYNISYARILPNGTILKELKDYLKCIIELKYDSVDDKNSDKITSFFPFNVTRSSKYVMGLEATF